MNGKQLNVLGTDIQICGTDPKTGYFRDGCCNTGLKDIGFHTVCAIVTEEFLDEVYSSESTSEEAEVIEKRRPGQKQKREAQKYNSNNQIDELEEDNEEEARRLLQDIARRHSKPGPPSSGAEIGIAVAGHRTSKLGAAREIDFHIVDRRLTWAGYEVTNN